MGFGIPNDLAGGKKMQSVNESTNVNNTRIIGPDGNPVEQRTYGQTVTVSNEYYLGETDTYVCGATNGQTGEDVITNSTRNSTNTDFQRVTETHEKFVAPASSSSTPQ